LEFQTECMNIINKHFQHNASIKIIDFYTIIIKYFDENLQGPPNPQNNQSKKDPEVYYNGDEHEYEQGD